MTTAKRVEHLINSQGVRTLQALCQLLQTLDLKITGLDDGNAVEFEDGSVLAACWTGQYRGYWLAEG